MKNTLEQLPNHFSLYGNSHNLLINEPQLELYPTLAVALGINEALVLAKLDSLLQTSSISMDGHDWCKHSYHQWQNHFPFWSTKTIQRTFQKLENKGYIISTREFNSSFTDRVKWYRIDYSKLDQLN